MFPIRTPELVASLDAFDEIVKRKFIFNDFCSKIENMLDFIQFEKMSWMR
jgi:hypothetical protein